MPFVADPIALRLSRSSLLASLQQVEESVCSSFVGSTGLLASRQVPEQVRTTVPAALSNKPRFPQRHPADRQDSGALFLHSMALTTSAIS
jgi:hypothetical protein